MLTSRRHFLTKAAGSVAGVAAVSAPALANATPEVRWKMASAFPPSLDIVSDATRSFAQELSDMTDGHFTVAIFPPGEIAPPTLSLDAVAEGKADCAHTSLAYSWTQDPAYAFGAGVPFGMNSRQQSAWLQQEGNALIDNLLAARNLTAVPAGATGGQMAGWFRKEIRDVKDLTGLKVRVGGFAGKVLESLGTVLTNVPKDGILDAIASGSLDGFEWAGPYDDEKFSGAPGGQPKAISSVAPYYYYPGWWKAEMQFHLVAAKDKFLDLPKPYQAAWRAAAASVQAQVRAKYDAANPLALKRLVVGGAQLRLFPQDVLVACYKTSTDLYAELAAQNPAFKTMLDSYLAFRADEYLWWQVQEYSYDNFMIRERRAKS